MKERSCYWQHIFNELNRLFQCIYVSLETSIYLLNFTCAFLFSKCILRFFLVTFIYAELFWHYYSNQIITHCVLLCFGLSHIFPLHFGVLQCLSLLLIHLYVIYSVLIGQKWLLWEGKNMFFFNNTTNKHICTLPGYIFNGGYYKSVSLHQKQTFCTGDGDAELKSRDR